jgi:K+-transporting ATPase ATPase C chain
MFNTALRLLISLSILTGIIYPLLVTLIAQSFFYWEANGSLIRREGKILGSVLIGQEFTDAKYFWSRPSATTPFSYNALDSTGSNLAATNPALLSAIKERVKHLREADAENHKLIPVDLVTASASGLDPHISILSALYQVHRIAKARKMDESDIDSIIYSFGEHTPCNMLGEPRINVLQLNIILDRVQAAEAAVKGKLQ